MDKYRIMFTIDTMGNGGAERVVSVLANKFVKEGHEVIITQLYKHKCDYELNKEIKLTCIAPSTSGKFRSVKTVLNLRKFIKKQNSDIIISFLANINIYTIIAALGINKPVIASERNDPSKEPSKKYLKILRTICYMFVDGIVFQTKEAQDYFIKTIQKKGKIIYNPIVNELPKPNTSFRNNNIVTVCRLSKQKNLKLLIDAFEKFNKNHKNYQLYIYGEGELRQELGNYIKQKKLNEIVFMPGFVKNVHNKIKDSSMFILSSDYEGMPNALIEAMAIGIPCISTDCPVGGPREFINQYENGILVPVCGLTELVDAMEYIINNSNKIEQMSNQATLVKHKLSVDKIVNSWEEFIFNVNNRNLSKK